MTIDQVSSFLQKPTNSQNEKKCAKITKILINNLLEPKTQFSENES